MCVAPPSLIMMSICWKDATAARLDDALDQIPNDNATDGVEQTALLLLSQDHGRGHIMFHG